MAEIKGTIDELTDEIAQLEATVKSLDKAVAEATELRQADHKQLMSDDSNAKELLSFAKNRLNQNCRTEIPSSIALLRRSASQ